MSRFVISIAFAVAAIVVAIAAFATSTAETSQPRPSMTASDFGDDAQLDRLWVVCAGGHEQACQELLDLAPPLSEYRTFAIENGARG